MSQPKTANSLWAFIEWARVLADTPENRQYAYEMFRHWPPRDIPIAEPGDA